MVVRKFINAIKKVQMEAALSNIKATVKAATGVDITYTVAEAGYCEITCRNKTLKLYVENADEIEEDKEKILQILIDWSTKDR